MEMKPSKNKNFWSLLLWAKKPRTFVFRDHEAYGAWFGRCSPKDWCTVYVHMKTV